MPLTPLREQVNKLNVGEAAGAIERFPEHCVGVKVRLGAIDIAETEGEEAQRALEMEAFNRALEAAGAHPLSEAAQPPSPPLPLPPGCPGPAVSLTSPRCCRAVTHHMNSSVPLADCPGRMRPGDIYSHAFHGLTATIIDFEGHEGGRGPVAQEVRDAQERGVLLDIGHGNASFSWTVAETAIAEGVMPDIISTDLHIGSCNGPVYDLPSVSDD